MQTNLDILDHYALALHGTASKLLQSTIGGGPYPRSDGRSTGDERTSSCGPNGGIITMETFIGPIAVCDGTILKAAHGVYAVKTIYDNFVL